MVAAAAVAEQVEEADVAEANINLNFSKQPKEGGTLRLTWIRSDIGYSQDQRATIKTLGLHRLHQMVERPDSLQLRGQVFKVKHLLKIEEF